MAVIAKTKRNWEKTFSIWSKPPGKAKQEQCERAKKAIKDAIESDTTLSTKSIRTCVQGSYQNRTNVRQNSDVDVCILYKDVFFCHLPEGINPQWVGITPMNYDFKNYKNNVKRALVNKFGHNNVNRGNKAFNIHESTRRVDADAVPCFKYRWYYFSNWVPAKTLKRFYGPGYLPRVPRDYKMGLIPKPEFLWVPNWGRLQYHEGTALVADNTEHLAINFPTQQYNNGIEKNEATGGRFKKAVRIIKKLSYEMKDNKCTSAKNISSFLIESLVWNVDNRCFDSQSLHLMTKNVLAYLRSCTKEDATCESWVEENGIKFLFHPTQKWRRTQAHQFSRDAWVYIANR